MCLYPSRRDPICTFGAGQDGRWRSPIDQSEWEALGISAQEPLFH